MKDVLTQGLAGLVGLLGLVMISAVLSACSTPAIPKKPTVNERIQFDRAIGLKLARQFEPELRIRKDNAVTAYLDGVGQAMADAVPDLHLPSVDVELFIDSEGKWNGYALPGGKIYLATGILRNLEFENEVAAVLAYQLGHIEKEHALDFLRKNITSLASYESSYEQGTPQPRRQGTIIPSRIDFLDSRGLFEFTDRQKIEAAEAAVNILYAGGYDPRGLVTLWKNCQSNPRRSPFSPEMLEKLLDATRTAIALHSPLRNPIVRTQAFQAIRRRFRKL